MISIEDLLLPIRESQPSGRYLRRETIYDEIQEARRRDDSAPAGEWQRKLKASDWRMVISLCADCLKKDTKDLQIAAWLAEGLARLEGWSGMVGGIGLVLSLQERFWDTVFPPLDQDDSALRARPLSWLALRLEEAIVEIPVTKDGRTWLHYFESRRNNDVDSDTNEDEQPTKSTVLTATLTPKVFDRSFYGTPWASNGKPPAANPDSAVIATWREMSTYHSKQLAEMVSARQTIQALERDCDKRYGSDAPSFRATLGALDKVQQTVATLAAKLNERLAELDIPEEESEEPKSEEPETHVQTAVSSPEPDVVEVKKPTKSERLALDVVGNAAAEMRRKNPESLAPYLMLHGMRWGELRDLLADKRPLPAPSAAIRAQLKAFVRNSEWKELLEASEQALSDPKCCAWLDLQRYVVSACRELGGEFDRIGQVLSVSLAQLVRDWPELTSYELEDGTNPANDESRKWLDELRRRAEPPAPEASPVRIAAAPAPDDETSDSSDLYRMAWEASENGRDAEAIDILSIGAREASSGRMRHLRRLQLAELCLHIKARGIARMLLEDLVAESESRRLSEWEDAEAAIKPFRLLHSTLGDSVEDRTRKGALLVSICRIDPAAAMELSN